MFFLGPGHPLNYEGNANHSHSFKCFTISADVKKNLDFCTPNSDESSYNNPIIIRRN